MAERRHSDEAIHEQGKALRRRGILAAAGAVVAGIMVKQTAQPVAAAAPMQFANTTASYTNTATGPTVIIDSVGYTDTGSVFAGQALNGNAKCGIQGVTGLRGSAPFRCGVYGDCGTSDSVGVFGNANSGFPSKGVFGRSERDGYGVVGQAISGIGMQGIIPAMDGSQPNTGANTVAVQAMNQSTGAGGIGVYGSTASGVYGVYGLSALAGGCGVRGDCVGGTGVLGQASTGNGVRGFSAQNHAIVGQTAQPFYGGVFGVATITNTVGIYGSTFNGATYNANAFAGYMDGNFVVANGFKSAAVTHADGSHRLVYCMESPENWFEDFGEGKLVAGKADVKIAPDFAGIVHADDYGVFLTPEGDCKGLYVTGKTPAGFGVREVQGGTSSLAFRWRIVAKRKDITAARLARFDLVGKAKMDTSVPKTPPTPTAPPKKP